VRQHSAELGHAHRELWEVVCDELRNLIIGGEFEPGEPLAEAALAARFAVSRGPVRTALRELERVGLVAAVPRRGMQVATFERTDIDELFDVTLGLERMAARTAAELATPEQVRRLHELLDELDTAQHCETALDAVDADLEFHRHLVALSGNRRLLDLWLQISEEIRFVIAVTQRSLPEVEWASFNRPIVDAIGSGDPDQAEAAVVACFTEAHAEIRARSSEAFVACRPAAAPAVSAESVGR
jgi:DNA-binding GntR family transcriptional regulator